MAAPSCDGGALCWLEQHDYIAAWLQGVGTFVALLAIVVTLEHFRRTGFRPRIKLIKDAYHARVLLTVDNLGRTEGRVDQIHVGTLSAPRWRPRRWSRFDIDDSVGLRFAAVAHAGRAAILPLNLPGATSEQLMLEGTTTSVFANPTAWVIVIAGGHKKRAKVSKVKQHVLDEDSYGPATPSEELERSDERADPDEEIAEETGGGRTKEDPDVLHIEDNTQQERG